MTWGHKIVERGWEGEGGIAEGDDRDMEKGRIGMNEVSVYNLYGCLCQSFWGKEEWRVGYKTLHI